MSKATIPIEKPDEFFNILQKGVTDVLKSSKSTPAEKIQAINAGAKLMQIKFKVDDTDDTPGGFFKKDDAHAK